MGLGPVLAPPQGRLRRRAVHQLPRPVDDTGPVQFLQLHQMLTRLDAGCLPFVESPPARLATVAVHLLRQVFPGEPDLENEEYAGERLAITSPRPTAQRFHNRSQFVRHNQTGYVVFLETPEIPSTQPTDQRQFHQHWFCPMGLRLYVPTFVMPILSAQVVNRLPGRHAVEISYTIAMGDNYTNRDQWF